jgi:hypothetical protein
MKRRSRWFFSRNTGYFFHGSEWRAEVTDPALDLGWHVALAYDLGVAVGELKDPVDRGTDRSDEPLNAIDGAQNWAQRNAGTTLN